MKNRQAAVIASLLTLIVGLLVLVFVSETMKFKERQHDRENELRELTAMRANECLKSAYVVRNEQMKRCFVFCLDGPSALLMTSIPCE